MAPGRWGVAACSQFVACSAAPSSRFCSAPASFPSMGYGLEICSDLVLHGLQENNLLHCGHLPGVQGSLCLGARKICPSFFIDLGVYRVVAHVFFPRCCAVFFFNPFLNMLSQGWSPVLPWAEPWPAAGLWRWLWLAQGQTLVASYRGHYCTHFTHQHLYT